MFNDDKTIIAGSEDGSVCYYNMITSALIKKTNLFPYRRYGMKYRSSESASAIAPSQPRSPADEPNGVISSISAHPKESQLLVGISTGVIALLRVNI